MAEGIPQSLRAYTQVCKPGRAWSGDVVVSEKINLGDGQWCAREVLEQPGQRSGKHKRHMNETTRTPHVCKNHPEDLTDGVSIRTSEFIGFPGGADIT